MIGVHRTYDYCRLVDSKCKLLFHPNSVYGLSRFGKSWTTFVLRLRETVKTDFSSVCIPNPHPQWGMVILSHPEYVVGLIWGCGSHIIAQQPASEIVSRSLENGEHGILIQRTAFNRMRSGRRTLRFSNDGETWCSMYQKDKWLQEVNWGCFATKSSKTTAVYNG